MIAEYTVQPRHSRLKRFIPNKQKKLYSSLINVQVGNGVDSKVWNNWYSLLTNKSDVAVNYKEKTIIDKSDSKINYYIVANGSERDFYNISMVNGIAAESKSIEIEVSCEMHGSTKVEVGVLEFGADLKRINLIQKSQLQGFIYTPSERCRRYLPFVKISGTGRCVINAIYVNEVVTDNKPIAEGNSKEAIKTTTVPITNTEPTAPSAVKSNLTMDIASKLASNLDTSNGVKLYKKQPYSVGIVTDEYMYNYYKDVFEEVFYLSPSNYKTVLSENKLDIIIYVTCWKGLNEEEWRGVKFRESPQSALDNILIHARETGAKTIFQSIEDPSNFEYFLPIAKKFDAIFTSDIDMVDKYKKECQHEEVYYGEYGVNTELNNPIDCRKYVFNHPFFAGSYARRYEERCNDADIILDSIVDSNVEPVILDRNYGLNAKELQFPDRFKSYLYKPVSHEVLQKLHKLFRFSINLNSIKHSPTMCAMRVYELQAQCTNIISNYAKSTLNNFPNVRILPTLQNLEYDFDTSEAREFNEYQLSNDAARNIISNKCSYKIVGKMLSALGFEDNSDDIGNIAIFYDSEDMLQQIELQSLNNVVPMSMSLIQDYKTVFKDKDIRYFTFFKNGVFYKPDYLENLLNGFAYTNSQFTTKPEIKGNETLAEVSKLGHYYVNQAASKYLTLFSYDFIAPVQVDELEDSGGVTGSGYMVDPFSYNEDYFTSLLKESISHKEPIYSIIVPTYNNGKYLVNKCLASLRRHANWEKMEVIFVDDGSTDGITKEIITELASQYNNIKACLLDAPASGSASRARNKGVVLASTEYIGFLDPDNEISPGGYDILYNYLQDEKYKDLDFISGYHAKIHSEVGIIGKHTSSEIYVIDDPMASYFEQGKFPVVATQPALIKRGFLLSNNIKYVEGAAGQDTLYGWEVLINSKMCAFTSKVHLIYYAQRSDSITNVIDKSYFDKKLVMEKAQVNFLKDHELLDLYKQHHFDNFMNNWYLPKVEMCEDKAHAENTIEAITDLYNP
ncbi:glycosyltransferase [Kangiella shandongensis]|uniref:glycosyltransferase n=1 Tax=Kangiella shandongensis TaxID=2763258 RepID=UPI001CBA9916|nr:glycosyltransferase [Kangiella shandongensis]